MALFGLGQARSPEERRERSLVRKIDSLVLSYVCLIYWTNYLDRTNFSNAYVSGMKEATNMTGDDFNNANTCFQVGYLVGMVPNNIALLKIRPRYWLSFTALAWGVLVLSLYRTTSPQQIYVIRFFQALFESSTFSGTQLILGSWYKETELTKRTAVFTSSGLVGSIFSGFMQSAIYKNLNGKSGLAGWQWLFIIDFLITLPIVIYGFVFFPDMPQYSKTLVFSEKDRSIARNRLGRTPQMPKLSWAIVKRVLGQWHWYGFSWLWAIGGLVEAFGTSSMFALWLENRGYPVADRNNYPLGIYAVGIVATFAISFYIDVTGATKHWHAAWVIGVVMVVSAVLMLARPFDPVTVFVAQYLSGVSFAGQATYFAWCNVVCKNDLEERAIVLSSMNMWSSVFWAWWNIVFYKASDAPTWTRGQGAMIATAVVTAISATGLRYLQVREKHRRMPNLLTE